MVKDRGQRAVTTPVLSHCTRVTAGCTAATACDTEMGALGRVAVAVASVSTGSGARDSSDH